MAEFAPHQRVRPVEPEEQEQWEGTLPERLHTPEELFLEAIRKAPDDDTPRLVVADWLQERGEPGDVARAQFIRDQCTLAKMPEDAPERVGIVAREQQFLDAHAADLAGGQEACERIRQESGWELSYRFERGFPRYERTVGGRIEPALPALIQALGNPDGDVRYSVAHALGRIGQDAVPALIAALKDPGIGVRYFAAYVLGRIGPEASGAVSALIETVRDSDVGVRYSAVTALGQIGPEARDAVPALTEMREDSNGDIRYFAARTLAKILHNAESGQPG